MSEDQRTTQSQSTEPVATTEAPAPAATPSPVKPDRGGFIWGTGRRKAAVARVRIRSGEGKFLINKRELDNYFSELRDRHDIVEPLHLTQAEGKIDVYVNVHGGGYMGQAGAIRLGLSRALKDYDPAHEQVLRDHGMLSRDPRRVERKKYGQPGARKRFQFSKR